jgi:hypothetical protein
VMVRGKELLGFRIRSNSIGFILELNLSSVFPQNSSKFNLLDGGYYLDHRIGIAP